MKSKKSR